MRAPEGPSRVPTENPAFNRLVAAIALTISQHQPVRRGDGKVGMTCRFRLCREPIFLTRGDGANHQSFEIIRTIRETADDVRDEEEPEDMAQAAADLIELLGLDAVTAPPADPEAGTANVSPAGYERSW